MKTEIINNQKLNRNNEVLINTLKNIELAVSQLSEAGVSVISFDVLNFGRPTIWVDGFEFCSKLEELGKQCVTSSGQLICEATRKLWGCRIVWSNKNRSTH